MKHTPQPIVLSLIPRIVKISSNAGPLMQT